MASTNGKPAMHSSSSRPQWKDQVKSKKVIYQEISEHVKKRRKHYDDLNDLLEKRERVISLSRDTPDRIEADNVEQTRHSITAVPAFQKVFIDNNELEEAIEIALATGCRVHGSQEGVTKKDILEFVKKLFCLTQKQVDEAEDRTTEQQSKLRLLCKVIRATDLKPKVGNGSGERNPYCRVGIMHQKHYHPGSEFKYMSEWQKSGNINDIATTDCQMATLEPVWNEDVELDMNNVEEEVVVVEVWSPVVNKEDFLGWMFHPLLLVPIAGAELKVTLMSRGKKPRNGFISLFLSIQADTEEKSLEACMDEHHLLTQAVIEKFSKEEDEERKLDWNGELSSEAERLLEYHGVLNGLNKLQMATVRLSELLKYHKFDSVEMEAFSKVIKRMKELQFLFPNQESSGSPHEPTSPLAPRSPSMLSPPTSNIHASLRSSSPHLSPRSSPIPDIPVPKDTLWVSKLLSEVAKLEKELMDTMKDHIRLVYFGFDGKAEKINPYLSALWEVHTFKPFINQMDRKKDIQRELEKCIEPSVDSWFNRLKCTVMPKNGTEPKELRDLCAYCLEWSEKVVDQLILHPTFIQAGVDYFTLYILSLDEQLSEEVQKALKNYKIQKPDTITFEIYTKLQELVVLLENADEDARKGLTILGFHKWFQEFIPGWIDIATEKCEARIRQAIELDEIVKITEDLKLSSSAVDTNGFILQMATFWKHLNWPIGSEAYGYAVILVENMCSCTGLFIDEVFAGLQSEDLVDDQGRFKASEKLCLVLNNMFHVREHMAQMQEHMELDKLYVQLREEYMRQYELAEEGGPEVTEMHSDPVTGLHIKAKNLIDNLLISADEDVVKKIEEVIGKICEKIRPDIQKLINGVVSSDATETEDTVMAPLFDYLTQNLITLGGNLLPQLFESISAHFWEISIEALDKVLATQKKKKNFSVNQRLSNALKSLREFYYCDGGGVSRKVLDSEKYMLLKSILDILGMPTEQLIVQFYADLEKTQHSETNREKNFGELVLSVGYSSVVEVAVIQGENLGDTEVIHEPYVKLRLSSICGASDKHWKTKPVKGMQKSPLFNEDIKLPVTEEEMNSEGALVLFYLLDKKLKSRSPYGMCVISCSEIPHLPAPTKSTLMDPNAPQRKNFRLPLFRLTSETSVLSELIARAEYKDRMALNFLITNDLLLSSGSHLNTQLQRKKVHSPITKKPKKANNTHVVT